MKYQTPVGSTGAKYIPAFVPGDDMQSSWGTKPRLPPFRYGVNYIEQTHRHTYLQWLRKTLQNMLKIALLIPPYILRFSSFPKNCIQMSAQYTPSDVHSLESLQEAAIRRILSLRRLSYANHPCALNLFTLKTTVAGNLVWAYKFIGVTPHSTLIHFFRFAHRLTFKGIFFAWKSPNSDNDQIILVCGDTAVPKKQPPARRFATVDRAKNSTCMAIPWSFFSFFL